MKIVLCTDSFKTGGGGVASYAHDFVDAFSKEYEFVIVTNDDYQASANEKFEVVKIKDTDFSLENANRLTNLISKEKPDIIVNSFFPLLSLVVPYLPNEIHVVNISHFMDGRLAWAAGFNANYADEVVALSSYNKSYLEKKFKIENSAKVSVVYNFMPPLQDVDIETKKQRICLKIVYPGGHSYAKSAEVVCDALKQLLKTELDFDFYWLGNITLPGAHWPLSRTCLVSDCLNSNDKRIKVFGPVTREDSKKIIADANIFLLPSRGEGCPITLLEAMRAGCVPIISDVPHGSLDIIQDNKTGFVVRQGNAKDIVSRITSIINNHTDCFKIYDNSYHKFNTDLQASHWLNCMKTILSQNINHRDRTAFNLSKYKKDAQKYKFMLKAAWLKDRLLIQPYHILAFRWIRYKE